MKIVKLLCLCLLMGVILLPLIVLAQEPTDRPFPAAVVTATVEPTDRPFPAVATSTVEATESSDGEAANEETAPELILSDVQATANAAQAQITQLEAERDSLLSDLEASRTDNGATTFALVIIAVGILLALAVFFGLRRSGE